MARETYSDCGQILEFDGDMIIKDIEFDMPSGNNMTPGVYLQKLTEEFQFGSEGYDRVVFESSLPIRGAHGLCFTAKGMRRATSEELAFRDKKREEQFLLEQQWAKEVEVQERAQLASLLEKYPPSNVSQ